MGISVLALSLVATLSYVNRQRKRLASAHDELHLKNGQLSETNGQLSKLNTQLTAKNAELSQLNQRIAEAGRVKEEYVGRFMRLC